MNCLRFSVPPDRISVKDESGAERTSVVGPYSEGDTINLYCEVFGGKYSTFLSLLLLLLLRICEFGCYCPCFHSSS